MAEVLLKTGTSLGTLTVEQGPSGLLVVISGFRKRMFGRDKVTGTKLSPGLLMCTLTVSLMGGESLVLKNMVKADAEKLQRLLA